MSEFLEPKPEGEPLLVRDFNKQEIETIIKDYLKANPTLIDEVLASRSVDEVLESYVEIPDSVLTGSGLATLTPEIYALFEKCMKVGKILVLGYCYLSLNTCALSNDTGKINGLCFGCVTNDMDNSHVNSGCHLEITIDESTYVTNLSEI